MKTFSCTLIFLALAFTLPFSGFAQPTFMKMYSTGNCGFAVREINGSDYMVAGGTDFYYNFHWHMMSPIATTNVHFFKTDQTGNLLWEKIYSRLNYRMLVVWAEPCSDGGFILTGRTNQDMMWPPDSNDVLLIKADANGGIAWSKTYDTGKDELAFCVRQTTDGGFIISGFHDALPVSVIGNTYALLIKTDASGNIQWNKKYQIAVRDFNTGEAFPCVVRQTSDGGYALTGTTMGSHQADVYVLRTDADGNLLWAKSYEHDVSALRLSLGLDIIESASGDLIVAGSMDKDRSVMQVNHPYILKLTGAGVLLSAKFFDSNPVQMFQSGFSSVQQTLDGGFFFTGMGGYGGFGDQAQLLKTDGNFNMQWSRVYTNDGIATMGSRSGRTTSDGGYIFTGKRQFTGTVLLKTNPAGFVPCKNPGTLIELVPSVIVQNRFPAVTTAISVNDIFLNIQASLVDTTTVCPVVVTTLPVGLEYFIAQARDDDKVEMQWGTASEVNNNFFVIEKSTDGNYFEEAGKIEGAGNSSVHLNYFFIDENPFRSDISYYRLKQVDYDGTVHYSWIVSVSYTKKDFYILSTYSDFEKQVIKIYFTNYSAEKIRCTFSDMLGKIIFSSVQLPTEGLSEIVIDKNIPHGIYSVTLSNGSKIISKKILY